MPPVPHFPLKTGRVRRVHDHQRIDTIGVPHRIVPGDDASPIMPDQDGLSDVSGIEEPGDIVQQGFETVGANAGRSRRPSIASEIRSPHSVSRFCKRSYLVSPRYG